MADVLNLASKLNRDYGNVFIVSNGSAGNEAGCTMRWNRDAQEHHGNSQAITAYQYHLAIPVGVAYAMKAAFLMTSAGAITILTDRLIAAVASLVLIRTIISSVTTGTVGLKRSVLPDNNLGIAAVTVGASQIAAMIQRFKRRRRVAEIVWQE